MGYDALPADENQVVRVTEGLELIPLVGSLLCLLEECLSRQ
jgi:hypothetical protein